MDNKLKSTAVNRLSNIDSGTPKRLLYRSYITHTVKRGYSFKTYMKGAVVDSFLISSWKDWTHCDTADTTQKSNSSSNQDGFRT
jgi:hypothetical protein